MLMIINIAPSDITSDVKSERSHFLSKVAEASLLGHHEIIINSALVDWILNEESEEENVILIEKHKNHIKRLGQKFTTKNVKNIKYPYLDVERQIKLQKNFPSNRENYIFSNFTVHAERIYQQGKNAWSLR